MEGKPYVISAEKIYSITALISWDNGPSIQEDSNLYKECL